MGGEVKTNVSDDFKALEVEMGLRHEGMLSLTFTEPLIFTRDQARRNYTSR